MNERERERFLDAGLVPAHVDARAAMRANACDVVGYHGGDPITRPHFQTLLGPPYAWPLTKPYGAGGVSTCAMVALGLLRRLRVDCADVLDGYADDISTGLDVAKRYARSVGAWRRYRPDPVTPAIPAPGDILQIYDVASRYGAAHVLIVERYEERPDGTLLLHSVDGGQVHADGLQMISRVSRPLQLRDESAWLGWRKIDGWIDLDALHYRAPAWIPERKGSST